MYEDLWKMSSGLEYYESEQGSKLAYYLKLRNF